MAVPFYLPEGGHDDNASSSSGGASPSSTSSDGSSTASSQSPNTTTSATQTPMQSPLVHSEQLVMAIFEAIHRYSNSQVFQYPPPSPSCSVYSPGYYNGNNSSELFFPHGRSTPHLQRNSNNVSFANGEEPPHYHSHPPPTPQSPQSMPTVFSNYYPHNASTNTGGPINTFPGHHSHYQYTPPPTPTNANASPSTSAAMFHLNPSTSLPCNSSLCTATPNANCLNRTSSDAARRSRHSSICEDGCEAIEYQNFSAGREHLQEFNGRIPPRKKKKDVTKPKEKKENSFAWPAVVTVIVFAMGCGFLVAR